MLYPTHGLFFGGGLGLLHDSTSVCVKYHYHESRWITHILSTAAPMATVAVSFFIKPLLRSVGLELSRQVFNLFQTLFTYLILIYMLLFIFCSYFFFFYFLMNIIFLSFDSCYNHAGFSVFFN